MNTDIIFPHLGIHIHNLPKGFTIFGDFYIAFYGIILALGMVGGLVVSQRIAKKTYQKTDPYFDLAIFGIIFAVIAARIYYVIFSWDSYKDNLLSIFNLREGGIAIYGAVIGAVITAFIFCKVRKLKLLEVFDTAICGLITGQIIGRWGNFVNREAFGEYTDTIFAMQLPVNAVRSGDITTKIAQNITNINGVDYIQVHPTFFYESFLNLLLLIFMIIFTKYKRYHGNIFLIYIAGYGYIRAFVEGFRTDQLLIPHTSIAVSQVVGIVCAVLGTALLIVFGIKNRHKAPVYLDED